MLGIFLIPLITLVLINPIESHELSRRVSSQIDHVTIFNSDQALLQRFLTISSTPSLTLTPGDHTLSFSGLPYSIIDKSVRIESPADISILDVKIVSQNVPESLDELSQQVRDQNMTYFQLDKEKQRLLFTVSALQHYLSQRLPNCDETSRAVDVIASVNEEIVKVHKELSVVEEKILDAQENLKQLLEKKENACCTKVPEKTLVLHVRTSKEYEPSTKFSFRMTYLTRPAAWLPHYDLRLTLKENSVALYQAAMDLYAEVWQETGESWNDVRISLSTSSPAESIMATLPLPSGQIVGVKYHNAFKAGGSSYKKARSFRQDNMVESSNQNVMFASSAMDATANLEAAAPVSVGVEAWGDLFRDYLLHVGHTVNISVRPKNVPIYGSKDVPEGYYHTLFVGQTTFPMHVFTYVVPSISSETYLAGIGEYPDATLPLLPSDDVSFDIQGSYVGRGSVDGAKAGQPVVFNLGQDKAVLLSSQKVYPSRKGVEDDQSSWFVVDKKRYNVRTEERLISLHNTHDTSEKLVILVENLPKSSDDDVYKVELLSPKKAELQVLSSTTEENIEANHKKPAAISQQDESQVLIESEFLQRVLKRELSSHSLTITNKRNAYHCSSTGNIYWAVWLKAGEKVALSFKYQITVPEAKSSYDII
eukprot:gene4188-4600_t